MGWNRERKSHSRYSPGGTAAIEAPRPPGDEGLKPSSAASPFFRRNSIGLVSPKPRRRRWSSSSEPLRRSGPSRLATVRAAPKVAFWKGRRSTLATLSGVAPSDRLGICSHHLSHLCAMAAAGTPTSFPPETNHSRPCFTEPGYLLNVYSMVGARPYRPL
jgi:hypothetical protein